MNHYYYEQDGNTYQVEADSYERLSGGNTVRFSHNMQSGPMRATFANDIVSIVSNGDTWVPSTDGRPYEPCPTDVPFDGNEIDWAFDSPYSDNRGTCTYTINLTGSDCRTLFYCNEAVTKELDFCPRIDGDPRNEGCGCCRELLPIVRSIRV